LRWHAIVIFLFGNPLFSQPASQKVADHPSIANFIDIAEKAGLTAVNVFGGDGIFSDVTFVAGLGLHTQYLGNATFTDISASAGPGINTPTSARGLAVGDLWNDGQLSVIINNVYAKPSLLINTVRSGNHWIAFKTVGTRSNRDGIGARIIVKAGKRTLVDEVRSGSSYISQNDLRVHFGLGSATKPDSVQVRWPSGLVESFSNLSIDTINTLKEESGTPVAAPPKKP
jgi:hypothetical protein